MARREMRMVKALTLSEDSHAIVIDVLEEYDLDYITTDQSGTSDEIGIISFPLPVHSVEPVLNSFRSLDWEGEIYVSVVEPEAIVSNKFGESDDLYEQVGEMGQRGIGRSELHSKVADLTPDFRIFALMTAVSALVATAGVLLDSLAILVGSMVIAPLIGPPMTTSVATVIDDSQLFSRSVRFQIAGVAIGLISSIVFAALIRCTTYGSSELDIDSILQISSYTAPAFLLIAVAFSAGFAGAVSISTNARVDLIGIVIAAAIMPPLGVAGVALVWRQPVVALGSTLAMLVNLLSINLAATIAIWYLGYHPRSWSDVRAVRGTILLHIAILGITVALLGAFLTQLASGALNSVSLSLP